MRIGIVADDLTGAMDAAAPFADRGMRTRVLLGADARCEASEAEEVAVLAVDTHTRDVAPGAAAAAVRAATGRLAANGMLPFKKIDSTLRGNVGPEIAAALDACGRRCALVAPAAPAQGRELRDGWLFVHGQKVGDRPLVDLLRGSVPGWQVRLLAAAELPRFDPADRATLYVADAATEAELDRIAALGLANARQVLLAGSSGLACALARQICAAAPAAADAQPTYRRLWFVVGSHNARSASQVRTLLAQQRVPTIVLPLSHQLPVLEPEHRAAAIGLLHVEGLDGPPTLDPRQVVGRLAQLAGDLVADAEPGETALFMTGGDTARSVLGRLGMRAIDVYGSRYPGVIHGRALVHGRPIGLVTKAGGFGTPDLFVRAAADLVAKRSAAE
jgi:uncharacterized protein YgbK (DUF1537 family)